MPNALQLFTTAQSVRKVLVLIAGFTLTASGCDQVKSVVNDVKSEVTGTPDPAPTMTPPAAPANQPPAIAELPSTPAPPDPAQIVAEFLRVPSHQIGDSVLRKVVDVPEAAAQITSLDLRGSSDVLTAEGQQLIAGFPNLQSLNLSGHQVTPNAISAIAEKTMLRELELVGSPVGPVVANALSELSHLQKLNLDGTASGDSAATAVATLPIEVLSLNDTGLTDAGLQEIGKVKTLKVLNVARTRVTGMGFRSVKDLDLVTLNASGTQFGVDGLVNLRGMKSLEELYLSAAGIIEQPKAKVFTTMPNLRILNLNSNGISGPGMHQLFKGMKNLEELYLESTSADDNGLAALIACRKLKLVNVAKTRCSLLGARALKERLPECSVHFDGGSI